MMFIYYEDILTNSIAVSISITNEEFSHLNVTLRHKSDLQKSLHN